MAVVRELTAEGVEPNIITFNALISACAKAGKWRLALKVFKQMQKQNVAPDTISFSSLITACQKGGNWQMAETVFRQMIDHKVGAQLVGSVDGGWGEHETRRQVPPCGN